MAGTTRGLVDVHAHAVPDVYRTAVEATDHRLPDGLPFPLPAWSAADHVALMDRAGIAVSWLSISSPGVLLSESTTAAGELSRVVNDELAAVSSATPDRFRVLASLPVPDVDAAIVEADRILARPGVVGVALMSNAGAMYPGAPDLEPLWRLLDRRGAAVLIHPTSPPNVDAVSPRRTGAMIEFHFETTRAVVDLVLAGVPDRYPGIRFIVPHAGACLPLVADRVQRMQPMLAPYGQGSDVDVLGALRSLWFDTAGGPVPRGLAAVRTIAARDRLVFGSDYPFTPAAAVESFTADVWDALEEEERPGLLGRGILGPAGPRHADRAARLGLLR